MGMVLFGTFISFVTDYFVTEEDVHEDVKKLNAKIDDLNKKIDYLLGRQIRNGIDQKMGQFEYFNVEHLRIMLFNPSNPLPARCQRQKARSGRRGR